MTTKFIVYGIARVGSNYFVNQLNNHPQIFCHYEIFHRRGIYTGFADKGRDASEFMKKWDLQKRNQQSSAFLKDIWESHPDETAVGYNIFPRQNRKILESGLRDTNQKKIILKRKDILKTFVSGRLAAKTGQWGCGNERDFEAMKNVKIRFRRDEFLSYLLRVFNFYNYLETVLGATRQNFLTVYHEDILRERDAAFGKVFDFLDVRRVILDTKSKFMKQNPEDLTSLVTNYREMEDFLAHCDFNRFFELSNIHRNGYHFLKSKIAKLLPEK